jgi:N-acetylneuraminate synthase/N,N'-diacetyllegionaminate synthase
MPGWQGKHGPYLIAEIGGNHEGDFDYAKKLTRLACASGVDAVKFQIYTGDTLVNKLESPERNAHFKRFQLSKEEYVALAQLCQSNGVTFTASVWDLNAFVWIDQYVPFYKVGSGDLTALPMLRKITSLGKPIILSTGLATLPEVKESVNYIQALDYRYKKPEYLALLQCASMYPIPDEDTNLRVMELFRHEFGLTVGYSDHTEGTIAVETAIAMGAEIVEMHFTDTREGKSFRDHQVSFTCDEIKTLIQGTKKIRVIQGQTIKAPTKSEIDAGHMNSFRRAVYPIKNLEKGTILTEEDLTILRPNHGIDAKDYDKLLGKVLKRDIKAYEVMYWEDISL